MRIVRGHSRGLHSIQILFAAGRTERKVRLLGFTSHFRMGITLAISVSLAAFAVLALCVLCRSWLISRRQSVRRRVSPLKVVTIAANGILMNCDWQVDSRTKLALSLLTKRACVFLFVLVRDAEDEQLRRPIVEGAFSSLIVEHQILYCQTALGRVAMAAQLGSVVHLDFDPQVTEQMASVTKTVLIGKNDAEKRSDWSARTFKEFVTSGNSDFFKLLHV
jgi:hypothetical protein